MKWYKNRIWDVSYIVKWYIKINKVVFWYAKY